MAYWQSIGALKKRKNRNIGKGLRTLSHKDGEQPQMQENRYVDRLLTSYITCVNIENPKEDGKNMSLSISKQDWGFYPAAGYATKSDFFV